MAIIYPGGIDSFDEPSLPEITPLSQSGTGSRNHVEHHRDLGDAVIALQQNAALKGHDHSGDGSDTAHGSKLLWANSHERSLPAAQTTLIQTPLSSPLWTTNLNTALAASRSLADTDYSLASIHHTLAARNAADYGLNTSNFFQAARSDHTHDFNGPSIINQPFFICTSTTRPNVPTIVVNGQSVPNPVYRSPIPIGTMIYERDSNVVRVWARVDPTITGIVDDFFPDGRGGLAPDNSNFPAIWQILPVAKVPIYRAESVSSQEITRRANEGPGPVARFQRVLQDFAWSAFGVARFRVTDRTVTDNGGNVIVTDTNPEGIIIPEPGVYDVRAEIHWDPNRTYHEFSFMQVLVNGQEISRMTAQYTRAPVKPWGVSSLPGQPQTNRIHFTYRFKAGDSIAICIKHDANRSSFLWHNNIAPNTQASSIELIFRAP